MAQARKPLRSLLLYATLLPTAVSRNFVGVALLALVPEARSNQDQQHHNRTPSTDPHSYFLAKEANGDPVSSFGISSTDPCSLLMMLWYALDGEAVLSGNLCDTD